MLVYSEIAAMQIAPPAVQALFVPVPTAPSPRAPRGARSSRRAPRAVYALLVAAFCAACEKDEAPPPLPAQQETAEAPQALTLKPEDAGMPPEPEKKATTRSRKRAPKISVTQCCQALKQNAASAPEPTKGYMTYAAQICEAAAAAGQSQASIVRAIEGALKGAGLPPGCR